MARRGDYFASWYGQRGQGKTEALRRVQLSSPVPVVLVDPLHEHAPRGHDSGDVLFRPTSDVWEAIVEAARLAWDLGRDANPDPDDRHPQPAVLLVIDEVDIAVRHYGLNGIPRALDQLARYGRHAGVQMALGARRPVDIPIALSSQSTDVYTFRQSSPRDLAYFKQLGIPPDAFVGLGDHEFLHRHQLTGEVHKHRHPWEECPVGGIAP